jgi:hypothetical protein
VANLSTTAAWVERTNPDTGATQSVALEDKDLRLIIQALKLLAVHRVQIEKINQGMRLANSLEHLW